MDRVFGLSPPQCSILAAKRFCLLSPSWLCHVPFPMPFLSFFFPFLFFLFYFWYNIPDPVRSVSLSPPVHRPVLVLQPRRPSECQGPGGPGASTCKSTHAQAIARVPALPATSGVWDSSLSPPLQSVKALYPCSPWRLPAARCHCSISVFFNYITGNSPWPWTKQLSSDYSQLCVQQPISIYQSIISRQMNILILQ